MMNINKDRYAYLRVLLLLTLPLCLLTLYSFVEREVQIGGVVLEKTAIKESLTKYLPSPVVIDSFKVDSVAADSLLKDTVKQVVMDTTAQRILFFGDSMVEGLSRRMRQYAKENNHDLLNVIWYSSSTKWWAQSDTLEHFLRKEKPTFIMITLGGNELFVRDLAKREKYIKNILSRIGDLPYVWIGPPNWKKDTGICDLFRKYAGKGRYFNSERLSFRRGSDHVHPTFSSAAEWMDSVAVWMETKSSYPIRMRLPQTAKKAGHTAVLQPLR